MLSFLAMLGLAVLAQGAPAEVEKRSAEPQPYYRYGRGWGWRGWRRGRRSVADNIEADDDLEADFPFAFDMEEEVPDHIRTARSADPHRGWGWGWGYRGGRWFGKRSVNDENEDAHRVRRSADPAPQYWGYRGYRGYRGWGRGRGWYWG